MKIYGRAPAKGEVTLFVLPRTGNVVNYEILGWYARESWRFDRRGAS